MVNKRKDNIWDKSYDVIHSEAIFGAETKQPLVKIIFRGETMLMTSNNARQLAYDILDTAHASDGDAFIFKWLMDKLDVPLDRAAQILKEFRDERIRMNGEQ